MLIKSLLSFCILVFLITPVFSYQKCSSCSYEYNQDELQYCTKCGESLKKKIACAHCGFLNEFYENYCLECTNKLDPDQIVTHGEEDKAENNFFSPKATIITDPAFKVRGTWGGKSDGKTIGIDGEKLADHHIYYNDVYYFILIMKEGRKHVQSNAVSQFNASLNELEAAATDYDTAKGMINYNEKLKVKDRIDLNENPGPEGKKLREQMKKAIQTMHLLRTQMESLYTPPYQEGRKAYDASFLTAE